MGRIGIGVIGVGKMGTMFTRVVTELPEALLLGVADANLARAQLVAEQFNTTAFADYEELIAQPELTAVIIATNDDQHLTPVQAATRRGKHVLIEKPLAGKIEDGRTIVQLVKESGVKLLIGHTLRYDPLFIMARDTIARGDIGEVEHVYTRRDGSIVEGRKYGSRVTVSYFLGIHDLDALRFVTGREITSVFARSARKMLTDLNVDDVVIASLRFDNGAIGTTEVSWYLPFGKDFSRNCLFDIFGTNGRIHLEPYNAGMTVYREDGPWSRPVAGYGHEPLAPGIFPSAYRSEVEHFLRCITGAETPIITPEDGFRAMLVVEAVEQSLREGKEIQVAQG